KTSRSPSSTPRPPRRRCTSTRSWCARRNSCKSRASARRLSGAGLLAREWLDDHDRDFPVGPRLILVVVGPDRGHQAPECWFLLGRGSAGLRGEPVAAYLHVDLRIHD